jgi:iron complex transport system permease protein
MNLLNKKLVRYPILFLILISSSILVFLMNIGLGSVKIGVDQVARILLGQDIGNEMYWSVIMKIRLPRAIAAVSGGASLAVAGLLLQIFFRNPIVEPFVLGISSGSTMVVGLIVLGGLHLGFKSITPYVMFGGAFAGALMVMLVVIIVARKVKNIVTLLVVGLMAGYLCSAVTGILIAFAEKEKLHNFIMWTMGSFSGFTWTQVYVVSAISIVFLIAAYLMCKPLNAMLLGEKYAKSMGVGIKKFRILIVLISSVLTAAITAFAGPIAFIGLAVPHIARLTFGTSDNRILIPAVILTGTLMAGLCDLMARMVLSPVELPLSVVTSFIGAPIVVFLLLRRKNAV